MKTAEQIAEKLWEKYQFSDRVRKGNFLAALKEYGELVRQRARRECEDMALKWAKSPPLTVSEPTARDCADAIERMELP